MIRPNRVIQAIEQNAVRMWQMLATHSTDARFETIEGATVVSLPFPFPLFNSVLTSDIRKGREEDAIREVTEFFQRRNLPWHWVVGPSTIPEDFGERLLASGFTHAFDTPGMAIDLRSYKPLPVPEATMVADRDGYLLWLRMADRGFGLPPETTGPFLEMHDHIGWDDVPMRYVSVTSNGEPVAFAMSYYAAGVAGIYCVATVPEARRQGFGEKAMHACLAAAVDDGYDTAILHSSRMGVPLYEKLGFKEYCKLSSYAPPVATGSPVQ